VEILEQAVAGTPAAAYFIRRVKTKIASGEYATEQVPCFCGSTQSIPVTEKDRYGFDYAMVLCKDCGIMYATPRMTREAFQAFYRVILPLAAPGLFAAALLVFIFCWNEFLYALSFTATTASRTVPVGIALFPGLHEVPWGEIAAASVVVTVPLVVLAFAFQRRIVEGLTVGAVKG